MNTDYPLKPLTTLKIGGRARYFSAIDEMPTLFDAFALLRHQQLHLFVLGGGSNVLIHDRGVDGLVIKNALRGMHLVEEDEQSVLLRIAAGEPWDAVVEYAVNAGWWGIENLSAIPGSAGALAIQNVGAYGQEASDMLEAVEVCDIATGEQRSLSRQACHFEYRSSVFNTTLRGKYIILAVLLRLRKHGRPLLHYADARQFFDQRDEPGLHDMRQAIITIRQAKLPDPDILGNAGSFFKNLVLSPSAYNQACQQVKQRLGTAAWERLMALQARSGDGQAVKVPTALLLDICDLKGVTVGGAAFYHKHPLIIVNATGAATSDDVMSLARIARQTVYRMTGLEIVPEPNLIGFHDHELQEYFRLEK